MVSCQLKKMYGTSSYTFTVVKKASQYFTLLYLLIVNSSVVPLLMCKSHFFSIVDASSLNFCEQFLNILLILSVYCIPISICKDWFMTESLYMDSTSKSVVLFVACMRGLVVTCKLWQHFFQIVCKLICTHTISLMVPQCWSCKHNLCFLNISSAVPH